MLLSPEVKWHAEDRSHAEVELSVRGQESHVRLVVDQSGRPRSVGMDRWGGPDHKTFRWVPCGGFLDEEKTFAGYTIPTPLRVGWYFGCERFATDGKFFQATIDNALSR